MQVYNLVLVLFLLSNILWIKAQVPTSNSIEMYLRCRNINRKRSRGDIATIKEEKNGKLAEWKAWVLCQAGKTVLSGRV